MVDAHMLEHADRDDPIEAAADLGVVLELETHATLQPLLGGALAGDTQLLPAERYTGDLGAGAFGQVDAKPSPTGADVEHPLPRSERKLGGDMTLLGELRLVQILAVDEVATGVLPIPIEKELVNDAIDVVVMRRIAPSTPERIDCRIRRRISAGRRNLLSNVGAVASQCCGSEAQANGQIRPCSTRSWPLISLAEGQTRIEQQPPF